MCRLLENSSGLSFVPVLSSPARGLAAKAGLRAAAVVEPNIAVQRGLQLFTRIRKVMAS